MLCCLCFTINAQTYNQCGFAGPSNPATEPAAAINPAYTAVQVVCADASFPECSAPADAAGTVDFAGDCGSADFDFVITNPGDVATGDGGAAILGVSADGSVDPTGLGLAVGDNVCLTGFCYDLVQLQTLVDEINNNGSACSAAESLAGTPVCPIPVPSSLDDLFTLAASLGGGAAVSVGDVVALLPQLDQLAALGVTNVPVCGLLSGGDTAAGANSADYCMEVVDCSANGSPCENAPPPTDCPLGAPFASVDAPTAGADCDGNAGVELINGCNFAGEYATINNAVPGQTYCFSTETGTDYLTIYDGDMVTVLASGVEPVCVVATSATILMQINLDDGACGTENTCRDTFIACDSCPPPVTGCDCPLAVDYDPNAVCPGGCGGCGADGMGTTLDFPCYTNNLVDATLLEICPTNPGETVTVTMGAVIFETNFDNVTYYSGAAGSGTGGTIIAGPLDGDQSGTVVTSNPDECLIFIVNSDGSVACENNDGSAGTQATSCFCQEIGGSEPGGCTVDAGEPSPATADVCESDLGAVDVTGVFADPGVAGTPSLNQNYVIVDPNNANDIITVSSTATLDLTGLAVGDQACVVSVAYTQETLDIVTAFVDAQLGNICVPVVGPCASDFIGPFGSLDLSGFLNGLNGAFETFGFNFTSDDIALWCMNQEITLPLSAIPGGLFSDIVIDLTTIPGLEPDGFCCDFSTESHCLTVIECNVPMCMADAPEIDPATGDCAADDGDMMETPFTWPLNAGSTENTTAPYITEYIVTETATGNIIGVFSTLAAAEAAANAEITGGADGDMSACIQAINHDSANLEALITDLDGQSGGAICGLLPCPVSTLEAFYNAISGLGAIDVATVVAIIGPPNVGSAGLDLGALLGLPPGVLVVDVPPFCYEIGAEVCATNAPCMTAVMGCTDPCDPNYDPAATADTDPTSCAGYDNSCNTDCTAGPFNGTWDAATCSCINETAPVAGCTNPAAPEYDAAANCDDGTCSIEPVDIPTLSQWGLITLALLLATFGAVTMSATKLAFAGTSTVPMPFTNFSLPFNAAVLRKALQITGILALIGFAICFAIFGAIFMPDIIGVAIAGPIFAYLAHLIYLIERKSAE